MSDPFKKPDGVPEGLHKDLSEDRFKNARGYSAGQRIVALSGQQDKASYTLYGAVTDDIAKRNWANQGQNEGSETEQQYVLDFAVADRLVKEVSILSDSTLAIDERALLGVASAEPFPEGGGWVTQVVGELRVGGHSPLVLRPSKVSYLANSDELVVEELVADEADGNADDSAKAKLVATMDLEDVRDREGAFRAETVKTAAAALFDRVNDGGWEQVSPVWLATTEGFLRVPETGTGTVPYGLSTETRPMEVTSWFQNLPIGTSVLLMLDRSGTKKLSVRFLDKQVHLRLEIDRPALDFVLSGVSCDTALLADPQEPPGPDAVRDGPSLHLVSPPLAPGGKHAWKLNYGESQETSKVTLEWEQTDSEVERNALHFKPHANWVRPWEAAINAPKSLLSPLRVLIPMVRANQPLSISVSPQGLVVDDKSFGGQVDDEVASRHGPIASFQVMRASKIKVLSEEWRKAPPSQDLTSSGELSAEPAVLRPEYRLTPVVDAQGKPVHAPFSATYADNVAIGSATFRDYAVAKLQQESDRFCLAAPQEKPELRREAWGSDSDSFGWWDRQRFFRRGSSQDHRLEFLEAKKSDEDGNWTATPWLRLSNDSLVMVNQEPLHFDAAVDDLKDPSREGDWTLESRLSDQHCGLSLFRLEEKTSSPTTDLPTSGPEFFLYVDGIEKPVAELTRPDSEAVVNRLVLASSPWQELPSAVEREYVTLTRLNCLFLEFERTGGEFQVMRGMLGWSISKCFQLKAIGDLQFTEFYERKAEGLDRTIEFNGGAESEEIGKKGTFQYQLEVYFWSAVLKKDSEDLRVICKHVMTVGNNQARHAVAIQDAGVKNSALDLSCDVALFAFSEAQGQPVVALDAWKTSRRSLFTVTLDQRRDFPKPAAFLKLRWGPAKSATIEARTELNPTLVPSWQESDAQVLPWFSAELNDRRSQASWLRKHRLKTDVKTGGSSLSATLYLLNEATSLPGQLYRACTLATPFGNRPMDVIAQWIPSPIKSIEPGSGEQPDKTNFSRLWLFDPAPRTIAEWQKKDKPDEDRQQARKLLAGLGWTREAVLEFMQVATDTAPQRLTWEVIDSRLLNRDATIGWLAWPLHIDQNQRPSDTLPLTRQVVHIPPVPVQEVSVRVLFNVDVAEDDGLQCPQVYHPDFPEPAQPASAGSEALNIRFSSPGLRVGTQHVAAVENGNKHPVRWQVFNGWSLPETTIDGTLSTQPVADGSGDLWVTWSEAEAPMGNIELIEEGSAVQLTLPDPGPWTHVHFDEAQEGLQFGIQNDGWQPVEPGRRFKLPENTNKLKVRLGGNELWRKIRLTATREASGAAPEASAAAAYFSVDDLEARLVGIFVNDQLRCFGREPVWFRRPDSPGTSWKRVGGTRFPVANGTRISIATIDMLGRTVLYEQPAT